jgi:hypothetical protein
MVMVEWMVDVGALDRAVLQQHPAIFPHFLPAISPPTIAKDSTILSSRHFHYVKIFNIQHQPHMTMTMAAARRCTYTYLHHYLKVPSPPKPIATATQCHVQL